MRSVTFAGRFFVASIIERAFWLSVPFSQAPKLQLLDFYALRKHGFYVVRCISRIAALWPSDAVLGHVPHVSNIKRLAEGCPNKTLVDCDERYV